MKVLVSGCAGFIYSNLCEYLLEQDPTCEIIGIDNLSTGKMSNMDGFINNPRFRFFKRDLSDKKWNVITRVNISNQSIEVIEDIPTDINTIFCGHSLADVLPSIKNPDAYFQSSVVGTHNLLEWMRKNEIKNIVYAASSSCYGDINILPTPESDGGILGINITADYIKTNKLLAPYALYKYLTEREIEYFCKEYNIDAISLRYFNVYGPRMAKSGSSSYGMVSAIFLSQYFHCHPLTRIGDGNQKRDFIYVKDVCKLNLWAATNLLEKKNQLKYDHYNVASGIPTSINELIDLINNGENVLDLPERTNEARITHGDISKLKKEYFRTTGEELELTSIKEGIDWLKKNESEYFKNVEFPKYIEKTKDIRGNEINGHYKVTIS